jgi:RNA polymerase primary sigma factor
LPPHLEALVAIGRDQGFVTHADVREFCPDFANSELDAVHEQLRELGLDVVRQPGLEPKTAEPEPAPETEASDGLDDLVNVYLREMARAPLLTGEQEVAIAKRIEQAEEAFRDIICQFGFTAKEHLAVADKLLSLPPKERFDRVIEDSHNEQRERHLKTLRRLIPRVRQVDAALDKRYTASTVGTALRRRPRRQPSPRERKLNDLLR